ncbi:MAG: aldose 1-epimerase family protein [bacterium]
MIYTIKSSSLEVEVNSMGAELWSIKKEGHQYLWQGDENSWKNRATSIFPVVGRLQDGKYTFKGETYEIGSHGLARDADFVAEEQTENKLVLTMESTDATKVKYPFEFKYYLIYEVKANELFITSKVENKDGQTMYFGLGGHTGFVAPIEESTRFEDYYLEFKEECSPSRTNVNGGGLLMDKVEFPLENSRVLNLKHELFNEDVIALEGVSKEVVLKSDKTAKSIRVKYPDMDYLGLWQTPEKAPGFLCIEPWTSLAGRENVVEDFEKHPSLLSLEGGKVYENTWSVELN